MSSHLLLSKHFSGHQASMQWCAQRSQEATKRDLAYTSNLPSSILFANPEEGT